MRTTDAVRNGSMVRTGRERRSGGMPLELSPDVRSLDDIAAAARARHEAEPPEADGSAAASVGDRSGPVRAAERSEPAGRHRRASLSRRRSSGSNLGVAPFIVLQLVGIAIVWDSRRSLRGRPGACSVDAFRVRARIR